MKKFHQIIIYVLSVYLSWKFMAGYWGVGPIFGVAVLLIGYEEGLNDFKPKHGKFFAASTLIYAVVFWIAKNGWDFSNDWLDAVIGSATAAVVAGSVLMVYAHRYLFKTRIERAHQTLIYLVASWYAVSILATASDRLDFAGDFPFALLAIALWQGIYLHKLKLIRK